MSNYMSYNQNQAQTFQPYQATQYFPQPQGSIYMIGNSSDVANVPVGAGLSAAICLREGVMYLKTIQNGSPMLLAYKLSPLESGDNIQETQNTTCDLDKKIAATLEGYDERLKKIELMIFPKNQINTTEKQKGGMNGWQL